ncbi:hypothetical protein SCHPADRAFT_911066 [Schizopora paradoxa]|uniref:Uncharacterized protein n=1 Tax=Schizopora paradoxa TaxID=27342 RepID=A0A0H2R124_9AGAM|nr:hypothetical protein SCHPADRAFT_911066 [Schizopora paradoxa]
MDWTIEGVPVRMRTTDSLRSMLSNLEQSDQIRKANGYKSRQGGFTVSLNLGSKSRNQFEALFLS